MATLGPVQTVEDFMTRVWSTAKKKDTGRRIFRGQAGHWDLLPKLFRAHETMSVEKIEKLESKLLARFYDEALFLMPSVPTGEFDRLSLAQHHGIPTRLMDWSSNPLLALFFAVEKRDPEEPTVWIYDATNKQLEQGADFKDSPLDADKTIIIQPIRHSTRVTAQSGWHSVHRFHQDGKGRRSVRALETMDWHVGRMTVIGIDPNTAKDIRIELKDMGIDNTTVYGDLGSACDGIKEDLRVQLELL